jgi:hypothetical protein
MSSTRRQRSANWVSDSYALRKDSHTLRKDSRTLRKDSYALRKDVNGFVPLIFIPRDRYPYLGTDLHISGPI